MKIGDDFVHKDQALEAGYNYSKLQDEDQDDKKQPPRKRSKANPKDDTIPDVSKSRKLQGTLVVDEGSDVTVNEGPSRRSIRATVNFATQGLNDKKFRGLNAGATEARPSSGAFMPQLQQCCNESNSGIGYGDIGNSVTVTNAKKAVNSFKKKGRDIMLGTVGSGTIFNTLMNNHGFSKQSQSGRGGDAQTGTWVLKQGRGEFSRRTSVDVLKKHKTNKVIAADKKRENVLGN